MTKFHAMKLIFKVFIQNIPRNYNGAYGEN